MNWILIEVYNHGRFLGSFHTECTDYTKKADIIKEINKKYGERGWTNYNIG